jgi:hypothetical protein
MGIDRGPRGCGDKDSGKEKSSIEVGREGCEGVIGHLVENGADIWVVGCN